MKKSLTAEDILSDIEFELVQGAISQDELGQGIQAVRRYQNKLRNEAFQDSRRMDDQKVITRLFQLNDMMITLFQETASAISSLRLDLRKAARLSQRPSTPATSTSAMEQDDVSDLPSDLALGRLDGDIYRQIAEAMRSDKIHVEMNVRLPRIPIIGGIIKRLRIALHDLVLFYVRRLAKRQLAVNQTYGDSVLTLLEICELQQEQINTLKMQMASLRARLGKDRTGSK